MRARIGEMKWWPWAPSPAGSATSTRMRLSRIDALAALAAILFTVAMFGLLVLEHDAFNSRIGDFARFSQAIWSVLDGKLLYTQIPGRSILGDHFSPIMVIAAPFLLIWPDERMLLLLQVLFTTTCGLILYALMRSEHPKYALFILLAFLLNPDVHEFVLGDFRRIGFALPWLALAVVGLVKKRRGLLVLGLLIALLAKESIALYIAAVGAYLLLFERDWRWGLGLIAFGAVALVAISDFIIPSFSGASAYPQLFYYSQWGNSYGEVILTIIRQPQRFLETIFGGVQLMALLRVSLPFGFLFLLDYKMALITLPYMLLMFLSNDPEMMRLEDWYMISSLPFLFGAVISGWKRLGSSWQLPAAIWLLVATIVGTVLFSPSPLGRRFERSRYVVDEHDKAGNMITKRVPEQISLLAPTLYAPHLTHVDDLEVFLPESTGEPFSAESIARHDYVLIDRKVPQHPYNLTETELIAQNLLADPNYQILEEIDGIYFMHRSPAEPALSSHIVYEDKMLLNGINVAVTDEDGFFVDVDPAELVLVPGQTLRVDLFWEALADDIGERTVSVRLADPTGMLTAQDDQVPAEGVRPTSWWQTGQKVRDVHYLHIPEGAPPQSLSLDVVVYDSFSQEIVPDGQGRQAVTFATIPLVEADDN
jgi:uncharacterized membrane protein